MTDGSLVDKELGGWMLSKSCDQQLNVQEGSSEGWGSSGVGAVPHFCQEQARLPQHRAMVLSHCRDGIQRSLDRLERLDCEKEPHEAQHS